MRRAQKIKTSREIVFIDSTSSVDSTCSTTTVVFTATSAGAVPLSVLIYNGQCTASYTLAFSLLKETYAGLFGGQSYPDLAMTDDSKAEKDAIKVVWPGTHQLLCQFHVAQAE
ncbi:uncharacterized protein LOC136087826 [Hydra vulgaris]|uniref:Uncharacterized protein LOC136087826 n=1 Tax=Hydra vulgaris TaxID=6087 RepID=A0ABM4CZX3_HYDVU